MFLVLFIGLANILENVSSGKDSACGVIFLCPPTGIAGASTAGGIHLLII
jgi:hypothetical protein